MDRFVYRKPLIETGFLTLFEFSMYSNMKFVSSVIINLKSNRMKRIFFVVLMFVAFNLGTVGQTAVPENVKATFQKMFPEAKSIAWSVEDSKTWEAEFKMKCKKMSANFDSDGKWIETETEMKARTLPDNVLNVVKTEFPGYRIDEACLVESPDMKAYEIGIEKKEAGKETELEVLVSADGKILKKDQIQEEDED